MDDKKQENESCRKTLFRPTTYIDLIISIFTFSVAIFYLIKGIKLNYPQYGMSAILFALSSLTFLKHFFKQCKINPLIFRTICYFLAGVAFFCSGALVNVLFYLISIAFIVIATLTLSKCKRK